MCGVGWKKKGGTTEFIISYLLAGGVVIPTRRGGGRVDGGGGGGGGDVVLGLCVVCVHDREEGERKWGERVVGGGGCGGGRSPPLLCLCLSLFASSPAPGGAPSPRPALLRSRAGMPGRRPTQPAASVSPARTYLLNALEKRTVAATKTTAGRRAAAGAVAPRRGADRRAGAATRVAGRELVGAYFLRRVYKKRVWVRRGGRGGRGGGKSREGDAALRAGLATFSRRRRREPPRFTSGTQSPTRNTHL